MNILLLTHYFPPEIGAPQTIHSEWIPRMRSRGHNITVVTPFPNYPSGRLRPEHRGRLIMEDKWNGVPVFRTYIVEASERHLQRRFANQLSFVASCWAAFNRLGTFDLVFTQFPPPFTSLSGLAMSRLWGIPHVLNVNDLVIDNAVDMGMLKNPALRRVSSALCRYAFHRSDLSVVTTKGAGERLREFGIPDDRIACIPNSVDTTRFVPDPARRARARSDLGWHDKTVILFHGTMGYSQGLSHSVSAADLLRERGDLLFVFQGEGAEKSLLQQQAETRRLPNVKFLPHRPPEEMPALLDACDIGLVSLRNIPSFERTLPSKLMEFMAMEKPVVLGARGDARDILEEGGGGIGYEPENAEALAGAISMLAADPERSRAMGRSARRYVSTSMSREVFTDKLEAAFAKVTGTRVARDSRANGDYDQSLRA
jgi:colanic acid biosynthesis glycosyl transferase WcaI